MSNRYASAARMLAEKYRRTMPLAREMNVIPYKGEGARWGLPPWDGNSWWTSGFWPALMWQLDRMDGDQAFKAEALRAEKLITDEFRTFRYLHHDVGFMYLLSCGANHKLTGNEQAFYDTLHAATLLLGRFNPVGYIRAWNGDSQVGYAIIDCMMNLTLLYWASRHTGDPRFAKAADIHAHTAIREFLREDGSVSHIIEFDPETGKRAAEHGGQGSHLGSQWSRGQAWGLYGFTLAYMNTHNPDYLDAAKKIAGNFIAHIRPDGLTDCDFCQPSEPEKLDNIAGAIAACGLLELAKVTEDASYHAAGLRLVDGLLDHCCNWDAQTCGVLTHCTAAYHDDGAGTHINIIYGDYFFAEALAKIIGTDPMLWL